jgi:hypothetical protein
MLKEYSVDDLVRVNAALAHSEEFTPQAMYEEIMEGLVTHVKEVFGRGTVLSIVYQIGSNAGRKSAEALLATRNGVKYEDPVDALVDTMQLEHHKYRLQIAGIEVNQEAKTVLVRLKNQCFLREFLDRSTKIRIGSTLCRVNKGYFEGLFKEIVADLRGVDISFQENCVADQTCLESILFTLK